MINLRLILKELYREFEQYESDTFSASGQKLKASEAKKIANFFLIRMLQGGQMEDKRFDVYKFMDNSLGVDGAQIDEVLGWLRGKELTKEEVTVLLK